MPDFIATAAFGLEAVVKREVAALGYENISVLDGRVDFTADIRAAAEANIWLRSADRLLLKVGEFNAVTFDSLFEQTKMLPWDEWIPKDGKFTVTGKSIRSGLFSVPDVQSIVKKAVVERLKQKYHVEWFAETGPEYTIQAALLKDVVTLTIDATGTGRGLHKRGYRLRSVRAPLKETMAAALVALSYWRYDRIFLDPVCGSGTLPIEAAMMARNIAPGLARTFACEKWPQVPARIWKETRKAAYAAIRTDAAPLIYASDIDPEAVEIAKVCAEKAGVDDCVQFEAKPLVQVSLPGDYGVMVANPPYGERIGEIKEVERLYADMGKLLKNNTWSAYVLTPDEFFETAFGRKADAKRKLFNGMIKTDYYQFHGKKPARNASR